MAVPDLFADSTMSFGEHLEALRSHLARCVVYLLVAAVPAAYLAEDVIDLATAPINSALADYIPTEEKLPSGAEITKEGFLENLKNVWSRWWEKPDPSAPPEATPEPPPAELLEVTITRAELRAALEGPDDGLVTLRFLAPRIRELAEHSNLSNSLVSNDLMGPFLIYIKAILVTAFVFASPLIFWELWMFVGAGLYPHERKYVYLYLPISLGLFFAGAAFCFTVVFQFVLPFLLSFNSLVETVPLIDANKWFGFALMLPAMFGLSFQLPLVMLALNRLGIVETEFFRNNIRMAILVISGASVLMTPSDPGSMVAMMIPLVGLYFVGIWMCEHFPSPGVESPFGEDAEKPAKIEAYAPRFAAQVTEATRFSSAAGASRAAVASVSAAFPVAAITVRAPRVMIDSTATPTAGPTVSGSGCFDPVHQPSIHGHHHRRQRGDRQQGVGPHPALREVGVGERGEAEIHRHDAVRQQMFVAGGRLPAGEQRDAADVTAHRDRDRPDAAVIEERHRARAEHQVGRPTGPHRGAGQQGRLERPVVQQNECRRRRGPPTRSATRPPRAPRREIRGPRPR